MIGAALLASLMWGVADFLAGRASRVHPAAMVALVGQAIGLVALALIVLFRGADADAVTPGIFVGLFGAVAVLSFYRALALGTMSIVAPIVATSAIVPVFAGVFDGERPGTLQWIGIVAALSGVVLASLETGRPGPRGRAQGAPAGADRRALHRPLARLPRPRRRARRAHRRGHRARRRRPDPDRRRAPGRRARALERGPEARR